MKTKTALLLVLLFLIVPALAEVPNGRLIVYSMPTGALACIDNKTCDITGATFSVGGNAWHSVVVTEKGYHKWAENIYVTSDQTSMITAYLDLDRNATGIQVNIIAGSGTICLDNSDCRLNVGSPGSTKSTLYTGVSPGFHTISVEAAATYADTSELVEVSLGKITTVDLELYPFLIPITPTPIPMRETGSIRVYVDRTGSTICLNNVDCYINVGGSPGPGTGTAVFDDVTANETQIITVSADGYMPVSTKITVGKDQVATADVSLQAIDGLTTVPTPVPTAVPTVLSPVPTARSGLGVLPVLGALALCGLVLLSRKINE